MIANHSPQQRIVRALKSLLCLTVLSVAPSVSAATIIADGTQLDVTEAGFGTGIGEAGFIFFSATGDIGYEGVGLPNLAELPSYASVTPLGGGVITWSDFTLMDIGTTGGTFEFQTGAVYAEDGDTLAEITFSSIVPASLRIGIFMNNEGNITNDANIRLELSGGGSVTLMSENVYHTNNFYFAVVTGAVAGDTITVIGLSANINGPMVGGITFDVLPVPEPSTAALVGLVGFAIFGRKLLRSGRAQRA